MKRMFAIGRQKQSSLLSLLAACALAAGSLSAQSVRPRIQTEINTNQPSVLKGSLHPLAQSRFDVGRMPGNTELHGMTIFFNRSQAQEAALQTLIKAQQNPTSPQYHKWLTPEEFGAQFGMADADVAKVESWLESEGFKVTSVNHAKNAIHFSGTAAQVERAFATEMHVYSVNGEKHFSASTALSVPASIAGVVTGVENLHDFHPRPAHVHAPVHVRAKSTGVKGQYTTCGDQDCTTSNQGVFFAPGDIKIAYDVNSLISGGNNGAGQVIAIMGQSAVQLSDIENFQQAAGLAVKDPQITLVPGTGDSTLNPGCQNGGSYTCGGDEGESDLDLEWAGAMAPGATVNFVYTGGDLTNGVATYGVFDSYQYAVDNQIGNIISISYGTCETELAQSDYSALESIGEQATTQGQTVLVASGDSGSTACEGFTDLSASQQSALAVSYPASSAYVTAVGGTEITAANTAVGQYWSAASSSDTGGVALTTALSYIPEIAWNDDDFTYGGETYQNLSASGGGISTLTARPSWQTGVTGIPSGSFRLVPDVALYSSPNFPAYLFCSSDPSDWNPGDGTVNNPGQTASCGATNGVYEFFDNSGYGYFTAAGGTSFATPIFAGMLAIVNQAKGYTTGQGLVNPALYTLAANSSTYASAFHDVTSGNNNCTGGSKYCGSQTGGYSAGTGYDMVTGLGSVDLANLVTSYTGSSTTAISTTTTVTPASTTPTVGANDTITISVSAASGSAAPTGTVTVKIDDTAVTGSPFNLTASGTAATASFAATFAAAGAHTITANYTPADATFASSTGTATVTAQATSSGTGKIAVAATPSTLTVSQGSSGTENLTVTGSNGYSGTTTLSIDFGSADNSLGNLCYGFGSGLAAQGTVTIGTANGSGSTTLQLDANSADCPTEDVSKALRLKPLRALFTPKNKLKAQDNFRNLFPEGVTFAGLLMIGYLGRRSRKLRGLVAVLMLATVGMAISACGGGSGSGNTPSNPPKGSYTGTITAVDTATSSITSTTTFTFVID